MQSRAAVDPIVSPETTQRYARAYAGERSVREPLISPLYADLAKLPPLLILVGDCELLLDDSTRLAGKACAAGTQVRIEIWNEMVLIWPFFASLLPEGRAAIQRMAESDAMRRARFHAQGSFAYRQHAGSSQGLHPARSHRAHGHLGFSSESSSLKSTVDLAWLPLNIAWLRRNWRGWMSVASLIARGNKF
jgi:hypothetical protein